MVESKGVFFGGLIKKPRPPNKSYKIRKLGSTERGGDVFGITVPAIVAQQFSQIKFSVIVSGACILYVSGASTGSA